MKANNLTTNENSRKYSIKRNYNFIFFILLFKGNVLRKPGYTREKESRVKVTFHKAGILLKYKIEVSM